MRVLVLAVSLLALCGCVSVPRASPPLRLASLDPVRFYTGTWYEIGRRPMRLTDGCVAGGTTYTLRPAGRVRVLDFCHDRSPSGRRKTIGGPARITDAATSARLHVDYRLFGVLPVARDYWVLARADDYSWFISADPRFHDLWIYTRDPHPTGEQVRGLVKRAAALGYDTSLLEFPETSAPGPGVPAGAGRGR